MRKIEVPILRMSFHNFRDQFLKILDVKKYYSPHTIMGYRRDINRFLTFIMSADNHSFVACDTRICRQFLYFLEQQGYHPKSIARCVAALRSFWRFLLGEGIVESNPWEFLTIPKASKTLPRVLSKEAMNLFLESIPVLRPIDIRNRAICELLYGGGLRVSECVSLDCSNICFEQEEILILGKGNKQRVALFGGQAKYYMEQYYLEVYPTWSCTDSDAFFLNQRGGRLTSRTIQRMVKQYAKQILDNPKLTPHSLRHSFATELFNGGADLRAVQELLGHSSLLTTQIYTHLSQEKLKKSYFKSHPRENNDY